MTAHGWIAARRPEPLTWIMVGLALTAFAALAAWGASPYAAYLHHDYQAATGDETAAAVAVFLVGWTMMIAAMMLPTTLALIRTFSRLTAGHPSQRGLLALVASGFLAIWVAVGSAFRTLDLAVHAGVDAASWLGDRPHLIAAAALLLAGVFQFTPTKRRCLTACRSPASFLYRHWHGDHPGRDAFRIGASYGASCAGCCWALMLVMFGLGSASVGWMLVIGGVLAVERGTESGRRLTAPLGVALVAAAGIVATAG